MTTRRHFLAANLIGAAGFAAQPIPGLSAALDSAPAIPAAQQSHSDRDFWKDWPACVTAEINQLRNRRLAQLAEVDSTAKQQQRAAMVRSKLWELIGGTPEKTPLNPRVTGTLDQGAYRIENIVFESFPKVYVTANLYIPSGRKSPCPAILAPVGHSENGKAYHLYQHLYQNLARKGYVVLAYDPFGQGERKQYLDSQVARSRFGPTGEHSQAGRPMVLFGDSFSLCCAWDGIRGLDYLVTRPEVDSSRLACTGQSGGGTMTMYLAALEPRLRAAVVSDGNCENIAGPFFDPPGATDDAEQNIIGSLPAGVDRGDLLLTFSPKPLLICYTTHDEGVTYSPLYEESTTNIYEDLRRVYELFGAKDQVALYASHLPHSLNYFHRIQTYAWFNRWLDNAGAGTEDADLDIIPEERLNATSTGQVSTSLDGRSVVQLNIDRARIAMQKSSFRRGTLEQPTLRRKAQADLAELLALPRQRSPLHSRIRSVNPRKGIVIEEFQFESQPGMRIPGWFVAPSSAKTRHPTILYLTDDGGDGIVGEPGSMHRLLAAGNAVCAISLRGLGITLPRFPHAGPNYYDSSVPMDERYAWTCLVMGRPVVGQRVWDTLRAIDYLTSRPDVDPTQIRIVGVGGAGVAAMLAGFLDSRPRAILADRTLVSYASIVTSRDYTVKLEWFTPGILSRFDIPDIAIGVSPRPCWILNSVDANGQALSEAALRQQYNDRITQETPLPSTLRLMVTTERDPQGSYLEWLQHT